MAKSRLKSARALSEGLNIAVNYAKGLVGTPYRWGGESIRSGLDCSGFIRRVFLASHPSWPKEDMTAHGIREHLKIAGYKPVDFEARRTGMLLFFGNKRTDEVTHVAMLISHDHIIEAGGGGSSTRSEADAEARNAFVRVRPFPHRTDLLQVFDPWD